MNKKEKLRIINFCKKIVPSNLKVDCDFIKPTKKQWAFYFNKSLSKNKGVIVLMPKLWNDSRKNIISTILHEIAHHKLRHKSKKGLTKKQIAQREKDAWKLADKWLNEYHKNNKEKFKSFCPICNHTIKK